MGNIVDYIKWRGDISMEVDPINEVDELAFSVLLYGIFTDVIPENGEQITIRQAAQKYRKLHPEGMETAYELTDTKTYGPYVLFAMEKSARFCEARLSNYVDVFKPEEGIQFAAFTVETPMNIRSIHFRGTDTSIDGWREDFAISFSEVGAQKLAYEYLNQTMDSNYRYIIAGHSKGGNLAEYSAMECLQDKKKLIQTIYSFDGPGICPEMKNDDNYAQIEDKLVRIAPVFSVVGMLFRKNDPDIIADSNGQMILQHAAFTWQIEGKSFVRVPTLDKTAIEINRILDEWIEDESMENRQKFTKGMFDALKAGGAIDVQGIADGGLEGIQKILKALVKLDKNTKEVTTDLVKQAAKGISENVNEVKKEKVDSMLLNAATWYAIAALGIGIFLLAFPEVAVKIAGFVFMAQIIGVAALRIITESLSKNKKQAWKYVVLSLAIITAAVAMITFNMFETGSGIAMGIGFLVMAGVRLYRGFFLSKEKKHLRWIVFVDATLAAILGILCVVFMQADLFAHIIKIAGLYLVIMSLLELGRDYLLKELKIYQS